MAHTHDNGTYTSNTSVHGHTKSQAAKYCKAVSPTHIHSAEFPSADAHTHAVVLAFASASLGSPNWWEHTHAITLVSCGSGGSAHNHTSDLLGAQCGNCPTPADHTHAQGTVAVASGGAAHAHAFAAGGVTGNADQSGTPAAHVHPFSITLDVADGHNHAVTGTYASTVCDGGWSHSHAAGSPTSTANHTQGVSGSTPSGGEAGATYINVSDSGVGSDSVGLSASLPLSDSGGGSDSVGLAASLAVSDQGSGQESVGVAADVSVSDVGSGSESVGVSAELFLADGGVGVDSVVVEALLSLFDVGVGSDSATVEALLGLLDGGFGVDVVSVACQLLLQEFGSGVDSVDVEARLLLEDFGLGSDSVDVSTGLLAKAWGYVLPSKLTRRLGISGVAVKASAVRLGLKAGLLDGKKVSMGVSGRPFQEVKCWAHVDISRLGRSAKLGVGGRAVVPGVGERLSLGASTVIPLKASTSAHGHVLRQQKSSLLAEGKQGFGLVAEALGLLEMTYTFMFVAVTDDKTCKLCMQFDGMTFDGADIERMFPYAEQVDYSLWMAKCHPSCRCMLVLLEVEP